MTVLAISLSVQRRAWLASDWRAWAVLLAVQCPPSMGDAAAAHTAYVSYGVWCTWADEMTVSKWQPHPRSLWREACPRPAIHRLSLSRSHTQIAVTARPADAPRVRAALPANKGVGCEVAQDDSSPGTALRKGAIHGVWDARPSAFSATCLREP